MGFIGPGVTLGIGVGAGLSLHLSEETAVPKCGPS